MAFDKYEVKKQLKVQLAKLNEIYYKMGALDNRNFASAHQSHMSNLIRMITSIRDMLRSLDNPNPFVENASIKLLADAEKMAHAEELDYYSFLQRQIPRN